MFRKATRRKLVQHRSYTHTHTHTHTRTSPPPSTRTHITNFTQKAASERSDQDDPHIKKITTEIHGSRETQLEAEFSASAGMPPPFKDQGSYAAPTAVRLLGNNYTPHYTHTITVNLSNDLVYNSMTQSLESSDARNS